MVQKRARMRTLLTLPLLLLFVAATAQGGWKTYRVSNGYRLELPPGFSKGLLVAAGTLQYFSYKSDSTVTLTVESFGNGADLRKAFDDELRRSVGVSYSLCRNNLYVISGVEGGSVYYKKTIARNGVQQRLRLDYPLRRQAEFDKLIPRLASSFR